MKKAESDLEIGNIPGVKNSYSIDVFTQTNAAAVTHGSAAKKVVPLQVTTTADLVNSRDVITEQGRDLR